MSKKHSPGPWRWRPVGLESMHGWDKAILEDKDHYQVLEAVPGSFIGEPMDARLIAAAPEMLEMLRRYTERGRASADACDLEAAALLARIDP